MALIEDKIERLLQSMLVRRTHEGTRQKCPDEESLANYLGGLLNDGAKRSFETHLAACSRCVDEIVALHKLAGVEGTERVPQRLIDRAMALVKSPKPDESFFDLVVRVVKDSVELVTTSGQWMNPVAAVPVGVRGKVQPSRTSILQVDKELGKFKVSVEVELVEARMCLVVVGIKDSKGDPVDNIRMSLISQGREQASYLTRHGEAIFDHIPKGEYHLSLSESGNPLGTIRLRMEEDDHE
jgi:hypothetical protein